MTHLEGITAGVPVRGITPETIVKAFISHLSTLPGARLKISVKIEAEMPEGVHEDAQRIVAETAGVQLRLPRL